MSYLSTFVAMFRGRKLATFGLIWLCIVAFAAIAAPLVAPFDPLDFDPVARLASGLDLIERNFIQLNVKFTVSTQ